MWVEHLPPADHPDHDHGGGDPLTRGLARSPDEDPEDYHRQDQGAPLAGCGDAGRDQGGEQQAAPQGELAVAKHGGQRRGVEGPREDLVAHRGTDQRDRRGGASHVHQRVRVEPVGQPDQVAMQVSQWIRE